METCQTVTRSEKGPEVKSGLKRFNRKELVWLLKDLEDSKANGILMFLGSEEKKALFFLDGLIIHAHSSKPGEKFRDFLLAEMSISAQELDRIAAEKKGSTHLGVVLLERELIYPLAMREVLRRMITTIAASVFLWDEGEYHFSSEVYNPVIEEHAVVPVGAVIVEGLRMAADREPRLGHFAPRKGWMRPVRSRNLQDLCFQFTDEEEMYLYRIRREAPIQEFVKASKLEENRAQVLLASVIVAGYLDVESLDDQIHEAKRLEALKEWMPESAKVHDAGPASAPAPSGCLAARGELTYGELLNAFISNGNQVHRHVPRAEKPIWERTAAVTPKKLDPPAAEAGGKDDAAIAGPASEAAGAPSDQGVTDTSSTSQPGGETTTYRVPPVIASRKPRTIIEDPAVAFVPLDHAASPNSQLDETLQQNETPSALRRQHRKTKAAELLRRAEGDYRQGRLFNVAKLLDEAVALDPENACCHNLLGLVQGRNSHRTWQKRAEQSFRSAIERDPWQPEYFVNLGNLYQRQGLTNRAIKQYKMALILEPCHDVAMRELDRLIVGM